MVAQARLSDTDWIKQSFIVDEKNIDESAMRRRTFSMAAYKFADTTLGGNQVINPPPQFTRFADIKQGGATRGSDGVAIGQMGAGYSLAYDKTPGRLSPSYGMGRYYSEAIDDNGQTIMMTFGVPEYNSLTSFFANFYDPKASALARTGRAEGIAFYLAEMTTQIVTLPLQLVVTPISFAKFLMGIKPSKFYYLKQTMPLYWDAVAHIVNTVAANMGLIPSMARPDQEQIMDVAKGSLANKEGYQHRLTEGDYTYHELLKDIYKPSGGVDVIGFAGRYQRLANNYYLRNVAAMDDLDTMEKMREFYAKFLTSPVGDNATPAPIKPAGIAAHLASYLNLNKPKATSDGEDTELIGDRSQLVGPGDGGNWVKNAVAGAVTYAKNVYDYGEGIRRDGVEYISFRVDHQNTVQESFSNQTAESNIASQINSQSSQARSSRFDFAEGNLGDGLLTGAAETLIGAAKDVVAGVASGLQISGIAALAGSAFVDIPKRWESASAQMPQASYTVELRSPYGNKLSRFQNLIIPLAMLLAGTLPLAAGRRAYTSPFLCQVYSRGRCTIRLGVIDSLSITRGTGNMGWTPDGEPLGIDVSFSISDLSTVMAMPLAHGFSVWEKMAGALSDAASNLGFQGAAEQVQSTASKVFEDDSLFDDYLAVLGSMSTMDQAYPTRKWKYRRVAQRLNWEHTRSAGRMGAWLYGGNPIGRILQAVSLGTDRSD